MQDESRDILPKMLKLLLMITDFQNANFGFGLREIATEELKKKIVQKNIIVARKLRLMIVI